MKKFLEPFKSYKTYVLLGCLLALEVVFDRIVPGVKLPAAKITFGFIPIFIAAYYAGPIGGIFVAGLGDFIGAILFPFGTYFPGYTLTAVITGAILGICLYKNSKITRVAIAVAITQLFCSLIINTYWIALTTGKAYIAFLPTRLMQTGIMVVAQIIIIPIILKGLEKAKA